MTQVYCQKKGGGDLDGCTRTGKCRLGLTLYSLPLRNPTATGAICPFLICRLSKNWVYTFVLTSAGCQKVPLTGEKLAHVLPAAPGERGVDSLTTHRGTETWNLACNHLSPWSPLITLEVTPAYVWFAVRNQRQTDTWKREEMQSPLITLEKSVERISINLAISC